MKINLSPAGHVLPLANAVVTRSRRRSKWETKPGRFSRGTPGRERSMFITAAPHEGMCAWSEFEHPQSIVECRWYKCLEASSSRGPHAGSFRSLLSTSTVCMDAILYCSKQ